MEECGLGQISPALGLNPDPQGGGDTAPDLKVRETLALTGPIVVIVAAARPKLAKEPAQARAQGPRHQQGPGKVSDESGVRDGNEQDPYHQGQVPEKASPFLQARHPFPTL